MLKTSVSVSCPRCFSSNLGLYGKHPKTKEQKFICKTCKHQFVPGHEHLRAQHGFCPRCGRRLDLRKRNRNTIQLRCSGRPLCRYSISRPLNLKRFFEQALANPSFFSLPKFLRFSISTVIESLKMYFKFNLSARQIKQELKIRGQKVPSHVTIVNWCTRFAYYFSLLCNNNFKSINTKISTWLIDETVIKIKGKKFRLFVILDPDSRFVIAWYLSPNKDLLSTITVLKLALNFTKHKPDTIISDHAQHFQQAIRLFFLKSVKHIAVSLYQRTDFSNNKLERYFSTLKQNFLKRRFARSYFSAFSYIFLHIFVYNFLTPHSSLNAPPALNLGLNMNIKDNFLDEKSRWTKSPRWGPRPFTGGFRKMFYLTFINHFCYHFYLTESSLLITQIFYLGMSWSPALRR
jgi:transposase-like protein